MRKFSQGIDFLGYVLFPGHVILRWRTKKRMLKKIGHIFARQKAGIEKKSYMHSVIQSYLGMLHHCSAYSLEKQIKDMEMDARSRVKS